MELKVFLEYPRCQKCGGLTHEAAGPRNGRPLRTWRDFCDCPFEPTAKSA